MRTQSRAQPGPPLSADFVTVRPIDQTQIIVLIEDAAGLKCEQHLVVAAPLYLSVPSTTGVSRAMPEDELLDQVLAEPPGQWTGAQ